MPTDTLNRATALLFDTTQSMDGTFSSWMSLPTVNDTLSVSTDSLHAATRYYGTPLPSTPTTEAWPSYVVMALAMLLVMLQLIEPGYIRNRFVSFFETKDRHSFSHDQQGFDIRTTLLSWLFIIGSLSLTISLIHPTSTFFINRFAYATAAVCLLLVAKYLILLLLGFTFLNKTQRSLSLQAYAQLLFTTALPLFITSAIHIFVDFTFTAHITHILFILCVLWFCIMFLYKSYHLFSNNKRAPLYLILYLCTLEIMPWIGIVIVLKKMI